MKVNLCEPKVIYCPYEDSTCMLSFLMSTFGETSIEGFIITESM